MGRESEKGELRSYSRARKGKGSVRKVQGSFLKGMSVLRKHDRESIPGRREVEQTCIGKWKKMTRA